MEYEIDLFTSINKNSYNKLILVEIRKLQKKVCLYYADLSFYSYAIFLKNKLSLIPNCLESCCI